MYHRLAILLSRYEKIPWWHHQMETFFTLLALYAGNSPVTGEFPARRPVTRSFDFFFDLYLNKRLSKQSRGWWFDTTSRSLSWRHRNAKQLNVSLNRTGHNMLAKINNDRGSTAEVQADEITLMLSLFVGSAVSNVYYFRAHLWRNVCDVHHCQSGMFLLATPLRKLIFYNTLQPSLFII